MSAPSSARTLLVTAAAISAEDVGGQLDAVEEGALGEDRLAHVGARRLELHDEA